MTFICLCFIESAVNMLVFLSVTCINTITRLFLGFIIVAVLPVLTTVTRYNWDITCGEKMGCSPPVRRSVWSMLMLLINAVLVYLYIIALENEKDRIGWACVIGFLQLLWTVWIFEESFNDTDFPTFVPVFLFGSVVLVLLNSVALMTELILKTVNGEGALGDLRIVVFSSECLCLLTLLIIIISAPLIPKITSCLQTCQNNQTPDTRSQQNQSPQTAAGSDEPLATGSNQNSESHEMKALMRNEDQEAGTSGETQPDSVVSQT